MSNHQALSGATTEPKVSIARVRALEAALRDVLNHTGSHSHWREGGAGGACQTCERERVVRDRARTVLGA